MSDLPEGHKKIEYAEACHRAAEPAGIDKSVYHVKAGSVDNIDEKDIIAPIANPRKQSEENACLKADHDKQYDCKARDHLASISPAGAGAKAGRPLARNRVRSP